MERAPSIVVSVRMGAAVATLVVILGSAGCTVCPDPFDYAGPVPDGTPPQNDFRARSGGILPVGAAPRPWPPVVRQDGQPATEPALADPDPLLAEEDATPLRQASILVSDVGRPDAEDDEASGMTTDAVAGEFAAPLEPVLSDDGTDDAVAPTDGDAVPDAGTATTEPSPPAARGPAETPGWRPRHRAG